MLGLHPALSRDPNDHLTCDPNHCDVAKSNTQDGFHAREEWFFKRLPDGSVRVTAAAANVRVVLDPNTWASAVASVSAQGETGERYRAALAFHQEPKE